MGRINNGSGWTSGAGTGSSVIDYGVGLFKRSDTPQVFDGTEQRIIFDTDDPLLPSPLLVPQTTEGLLSYNEATSEITVLVPGIYWMNFRVQFQPNPGAVGGISVRPRLNGGGFYSLPVNDWQDFDYNWDAAAAPSGSWPHGAFESVMLAGSVITLVAFSPEEVDDAYTTFYAYLHVARIA